MEPIEQRCGLCRFWPRSPWGEIYEEEVGRAGKDESECRRRAPTSSTEPRHPWTSANHWCGEWEARPPPDPLGRDGDGVSRRMREFLAGGGAFRVERRLGDEGGPQKAQQGMTGMIERVARALEPRAFKCLDRGYCYGPGHIPEHNIVGMRNAHARVERARKKALVVIEAIREPTWDMALAGVAGYSAEMPEGERFDGSGIGMKQAYRAMIDAALTDHAPQPSDDTGHLLSTEANARQLKGAIEQLDLPEVKAPADFRSFYMARNNCPWPAAGHEPHHVVMQRLAETMADFADLLAKAG